MTAGATFATAAAADDLSGEGRGAARWGVSFVAVLALHAAAGGAPVTWQSQPPLLEPPPGAVMIDLAPLPPAASPPAAEPQPPTVEAPPPEPPPPEPVPPEPPPPEPVLTEPPPPEPVREAEVALPAKPPEPPKPEPAKREPPKPSPPKPRPMRQTPPRQQPTPPVTAATPSVAAPSAAPVVAPPSAPSPAMVRTWQTDLLAHLERHKRYPRTSQTRGEQGTSFVRFTIDRGGRVLQCRLERGSGFTALDDETVALLGRASPLPAPPDGETRSIIEMVVPVRYAMR
jgi:protein TonB